MITFPYYVYTCTYICIYSCLKCLGVHVGEFGTYLNFCRSLKFEDKPDYTYLRQLFRTLFHRLGYTYDYVFDWNTAGIVRHRNYMYMY